MIEFGELLGEGGMGQVWKAVDRNTNRFVAKKYLKSIAPEDRKRFEREARMLFGARGVENIVQIIDYRLQFQNPYIVRSLRRSARSITYKRPTFSLVWSKR